MRDNLRCILAEFIEENWDDIGIAETGMSRKEAACYLGHTVNGMSREEIDEEIYEIQKAYYCEMQATDNEYLNVVKSILNRGN